MSKILKLDPSIDLWLTMSWSSNNHGICGHVYEIIEYFYILQNDFNVGILISEDLDWNILEKAIRSKYSFSEEFISKIRSRTIFNNRPRIVIGKNILFVDGGVINTSSILLNFENVFYFACGNKEIKNNEKRNVYILQDNRVYEPVKLNGIDYKKRILFDKFKLPSVNIPDVALIYATKNCRNFNEFENILCQYNKPLLVITNEENKPTKTTKEIKFVTPPVKDLFNMFSTYIYTPVNRMWDCSPRFIAECKYFNKQIIFHNIDYWETDKGLFWRNWDIENNFNDLFLTTDDQIISILKHRIK